MTQNSGSSHNPRYDDFLQAVWSICDLNEEPRIKKGRLHTMWSKSKPIHGAAFDQHWTAPANMKNSNYALIHMAGDACDVDELQTRLVLIAWLKRHIPTLTAAQAHKWTQISFTPVWNQVQPHLQKGFEKRQRRRKDNRRKVREQPNDMNLQDKIRGLAYAQETICTLEIRQRIGCSREAAWKATSRMVQEGVLIRVGRGRFAHPKPHRPAPVVQEIETRPQPAPQRTKKEPRNGDEWIRANKGKWKPTQTQNFTPSPASAAPSEEWGQD